LEASVSGLSRATDGADRVVTFLGLAVQAAFLGIVLIAALCVSVLIIAGTFAALHPGDDLPSMGGGSGGGGDVVVVPSFM
jgi:hypothetical protein